MMPEERQDYLMLLLTNTYSQVEELARTLPMLRDANQRLDCMRQIIALVEEAIARESQ